MVKKIKKAVKSVTQSVKTVAKEVFRPGPLLNALKPTEPKMPEIPENNPGAADAKFIDEAPPAPELGGDQSEAGVRSRKKGRAALRIDLRTGSAGAGGAGINVPRG